MAGSIKRTHPLYCLLLSCSLLMVLSQAVQAAPERLPSFKLKTLKAGEGVVTEADLQGKVTLLNIWASWCPGCKDEMPELMELQDDFGSERFWVVAVNIDNKLENAVSFMEKFPERIGRALNFQVLYDQDKILAKALRPTLLPTSYLIDAQGRIILILGGSITKDRLGEVREAIRSAVGAP